MTAKWLLVLVLVQMWKLTHRKYFLDKLAQIKGGESQWSWTDASVLCKDSGTSTWTTPWGSWWCSSSPCYRCALDFVLPFHWSCYFVQPSTVARHLVLLLMLSGPRFYWSDVFLLKKKKPCEKSDSYYYHHHCTNARGILPVPESWNQKAQYCTV